MQTVKRVYLTFDCDGIDHVNNGKTIDEFPFIEKVLLPVLKGFDVRATWFLRLDEQMGQKMGTPDAIFQKQARVIDRMREQWHRIGWHPHFFKGGKQNCDEASILGEIERLAPFLDRHRLDISRLGWGFMTDGILKRLSEIGMHIDSTAIPRPIYKFETTKKNWSITGQLPYKPSVEDYRRKASVSECEVEIQECPVTTFAVHAPYDQFEVIRYCNPAYHHIALKEGIEASLKERDYLMTLTHPYELMNGRKHDLIAFDIEAFTENLKFIIQQNGHLWFDTLNV